MCLTETEKLSRKPQSDCNIVCDALGSNFVPDIQFKAFHAIQYSGVKVILGFDTMSHYAGQFLFVTHFLDVCSKAFLLVYLSCFIYKQNIMEYFMLI